MWFNVPKYDEVNQYLFLLREFISVYKEIIYDNCVLCSIGKEVVFEYEGDCYKTICNSHNIDVWILLSDVYDSVIKKDPILFSQYNTCTQANFVLLYKKCK